MAKLALFVGVFTLLTQAPEALAEGFNVTVFNLQNEPQDGARVELWFYSDAAMAWVKETQAYTANGGRVTFYKDNPVSECDIPYSSCLRKLKAYYWVWESAWSAQYVYDGPEDDFDVDLNLQ
ncbi:MAG: hypothetical protein ABIK86_08480 [candidate division WOR-3 bacterium]